MTAKAIFELNAELRHDQGKGASRRLRRAQDKIPAIIYGGGEAPQALTLDHKKVMHALENQAFYSHILTINVDGKKQQAVLKDLQRHHFKKAIFHMDFLRVNATDLINMHVPIHFIGEASCPGVKAGGIVNHRMIDMEIRCLASALPEYIEIDISKMVLDESIHLSQIKVPKGVQIVALSQSHGQEPEYDHAVVSIHIPKRATVEEETPTAAAEATKTTEVAPKGKEGATPAAGSKEKGKGK
jgi:large subunit ribosomal protein L25